MVPEDFFPDDASDNLSESSLENESVIIPGRLKFNDFLLFS